MVVQWVYLVLTVFMEIVILKIKKTIESKINSKKILKAWAQSVQPPDKYKWETKAEDNWLESNKMKS